MSVRIALAQINCRVGDIHGNVSKIISRIKEAKQADADIVVFPELATTGYPPEDLLLKESFIKDNMNAVAEIKGFTKSIIAVVGFVESDSTIYNSAAIIQNGEIAGVYRKSHLPNYGVFDENRYFKSESSVSVYRFGALTFGVNICEDIWHLGNPAKKQVSSGNSQLIINISSSPYHFKKPEEREKMLIKRASRYGCHLAFCNLAGGQDELVFDGNSCVIDNTGEVISRAAQFQEDMLLTDVDIKKPLKKKNKGSGADKVSPKNRAVQSVKLQPPKNKVKRSIMHRKNEFKSEEREVFDALVLGTRDYAVKNGFKKTIIGFSGGIDSSLVAVIAAEALGARNVIGIIMPSKYSSKGSVQDSLILAKNLGIETRTIPINKIFNSYLKSLEVHFSNRPFNKAEENIQARIRGNILMSLSNKFGYLVLTTANKSETSVGYSTLYGDMAGGFAVIKDIPKMLIYRLAQFYNGEKSRDVIPTSVITKPPSAELRPGQRDTDSLPPYEELDRILKYYIEDDLSVKEIINRGEDENTVKQVAKMVDQNEYKRRQSPVGIKITSKAFGKDRRMPITMGYNVTSA